MVRDVRDHHPVAVQVRAGNLLDPRQRLGFNGAELREVDLRPRQEIDAADAGTGWCRGRRRLRAGGRALGETLDVFSKDPPLGTSALHATEIHTQFARDLAHAWPCVGESEGDLVDGAGRRRGLRGGRRGRCRGRRGRGRAGCSGRAAPGRQCQHHCTLRHLVADLDVNGLHRAPKRRRHIHRGLLRFQRDERIFGFHRVAGLDEDFNHRHVLEIADVRYAHFGDAAGRTRRRRRRRDRCLRRGCRRSRRRARSSVEQQNHAAFAHLVAELDLEFLHRPGGGRRHFHRRLVRFERNERVFRLYGIAHLDHDFDDRNVLEVADVRHFYFGYCAHVAPIQNDLRIRRMRRFTRSRDRAARYRVRTS